MVTEAIQSDRPVNTPKPPAASRDLRAVVARFAAPIRSRSLLQLATSLGLFVAGCVAMHLVYPISYLLTLAIAVPTGAVLVRVFIVQHDCGHGAFFRSRAANAVLGHLCSVMTLTPYANWRRQHARHHGNWNNLDRRHAGADIYSSCLTVREYEALPARSRLVYRATRHPLVANLLLPPFIFLLLYRFPFDTPRDWPHERRSVHATNLALGAAIVTAGLLLGFGQVLLVQLPIMVVASIIGVWLFSIQHRFEGVVWTRQAEWSAASASLAGSSHLRLPGVLQWFTGNIGLHHIHHLDPRVPNYRLQACHDAASHLAKVPTLSFAGGWRSLWLALWDEEHRRMIGFGELRRLRRQ